MHADLRPAAFADIAGWEADDHAAALRVLRKGADAFAVHPPISGAFGIEASRLRLVIGFAVAAGDLDRPAARKFFETHFCPVRIAARGFVTAYYEPEIEARLTPADDFAVPLYRRPADLIEVDPASAPAGWPLGMRFGRATPTGPKPYFDRAAIEAGALAGRGLELAWLRSRVDAFFIHVQGSARLLLPQGKAMRVGYHGKTGHAYTSIGRLAVERGLLTLEEAHRDGLDAWLRENPESGHRLMAENRSFIFFRETGQAADDGPIGAAGVQLTAFRSLAVDAGLITYHAPIWVAAAALKDPERPEKPFRRLMVAQDTGSAIVGPARGDLFFGSGERAGALAGRVRHEAEMFVLVPRSERGG